MASTNTVLLAGGIAAFSVDLLIYPLDTLKTRIQATPQKLSPALFRGLYQGVGSVIIATLPACTSPYASLSPPNPPSPHTDIFRLTAGAFFTTYEHSNRLLSSSFPSIPTPAIHSLSSSLAETLSCAILCPAEVIKQNAQVAPAAQSGFLSVLRALPTKTALFKGYSALLARNLPNVALQFPLFEYFRSRSHLTTVPVGDGRRDVGRVIAHNAVSAGLAAGCSSVVTNPVDLVKTKVMLLATRKEGVKVGYRGVVEKIWKEEGWRGFWRGGGLRVLWMAGGAGVYLGSYEGAKVWLGGEPESGMDGMV